MFGCVRFLGITSVFCETLCFLFVSCGAFGSDGAGILHNGAMLYAQQELFYFLFLLLFCRLLWRCKSVQCCPFLASLWRLLSEWVG